MPFCHWCGREVAVGTEVCPACGYSLTDTKAGASSLWREGSGTPMTLSSRAVAKTMKWRRTFEVAGAVTFTIGAVLAIYGTNDLLCGIGYTMGSACGYSIWDFTAGTFGGILLGAGLGVLAVGMALGRYVYLRE